MNVYIGSTFQAAGSLQQNGNSSDFTGWFAQFSVFDYSGANKIADLSFQWLAQNAGSFVLSATDTSSWPASKARIDCKLTTPYGEIILGPPMYIRILQSPMA